MTTKLLDKQIFILQALSEKLDKASSPKARLELLAVFPLVTEYLDQVPNFQEEISSRRLEEQIVLLSVIAIGQGPVVFQNVEKLQDRHQRIEELL